MEKAEVLKKYNDYQKRIKELKDVIHVEESLDKIAEYEQKMSEDDF